MDVPQTFQKYSRQEVLSERLMWHCLSTWMWMHLPWKFLFLVNGQSIPVSNGFETQTVEGYSEKNDVISWTYPEEEMEVQLTKKENYLEVKITSLADTDHSFVWPSISADEYYLPLGEGKRVPANDTAWIDYLDQ